MIYGSLAAVVRHGNFDVILTLSHPCYQPYTTPHAPYDALFSVTMLMHALIGC